MPIQTITLASGSSKLVRPDFFDAGGNPVAAPGPITWDAPPNVTVNPDPGGDPTKYQLSATGAAGTANLRTYSARNSPQQVIIDTTIDVIPGPAVSGVLTVVG